MTTIDILKLQSLLDRYYAGETSADDERQLRELLAHPDLPAQFEADREMMGHIATLLPPEDFEKRISGQIDRLAANGTSHRRVMTFRWSAAAAVILIIGLGFSFFSNNPQPETQMTPEEAYAQTEMALELFAKTLNKGYAEIDKAEKVAKTSTGKAFKSLETIGIYINSNSNNPNS